MGVMTGAVFLGVFFVGVARAVVLLAAFLCLGEREREDERSGEDDLPRLDEEEEEVDDEDEEEVAAGFFFAARGEEGRRLSVLPFLEVLREGEGEWVRSEEVEDFLLRAGERERDRPRSDDVEDAFLLRTGERERDRPRSDDVVVVVVVVVELALALELELELDEADAFDFLEAREGEEERDLEAVVRERLVIVWETCSFRLGEDALRLFFPASGWLDRGIVQQKLV
jgi:hypothetical protein